MNTKEYNQSVEDYSGRLFRFALKLVRDEAIASDVVQESYLRLWVDVKKITLEKAKSWLFTTVYRESLRQISLKNRAYDYDPLDQGNEEPQNPDLKEILEKCMSTLPEIHRSILMLRDYEGYNYKEIGNILDINESQVKVYLFRARNKMKEMIRDLNWVI